MTLKSAARLTLRRVSDDDIACTLPTEAVGDRLAEWRAVRGRVVRREAIPGGLRIHLGSEPGLAAQVADLAEREQGCCSFFAFAVRVDAAGVALEVTAPDEAAGLVTELFG